MLVSAKRVPYYTTKNPIFSIQTHSLGMLSKSPGARVRSRFVHGSLLALGVIWRGEPVEPVPLPVWRGPLRGPWSGV